MATEIGRILILGLGLVLSIWVILPKHSIRGGIKIVFLYGRTFWYDKRTKMVRTLDGRHSVIDSDDGIQINLSRPYLTEGQIARVYSILVYDPVKPVGTGKLQYKNPIDDTVWYASVDGGGGIKWEWGSITVKHAVDKDRLNQVYDVFKEYVTTRGKTHA